VKNIDMDEVERLHWDEQESIRSIAETMGVSDNTIRYRMKNANVPIRSHSSAVELSNRRVGCRFSTNTRGYEEAQAYVGGEAKKVYIHRLVAVAEYGVEAVKGMDVHHKNNVPWDNRPSNLDVLTHREHGKVSGEKAW